MQRIVKIGLMPVVVMTNKGRVELGYVFQIAVRNKQQDIRFLNLVQIMWITNFIFFFKKYK